MKIINLCLDEIGVEIEPDDIGINGLFVYGERLKEAFRVNIKVIEAAMK